MKNFRIAVENPEKSTKEIHVYYDQFDLIGHESIEAAIEYFKTTDDFKLLLKANGGEITNEQIITREI